MRIEIVPSKDENNVFVVYIDGRGVEFIYDGTRAYRRGESVDTSIWQRLIERARQELEKYCVEKGLATFVEFPDQEIRLGVEYARAKCGVDINFEFLRHITNRTRELMARKNYDFPAARMRILDGVGLRQRNAEEVKLRRAYSRAVAKIFHNRKMLVKAAGHLREGVPRQKFPTNEHGQQVMVL